MALKNMRVILHGGGDLSFADPHIQKILNGEKSMLFIPYARPDGITCKKYTSMVHDALEKRLDVTGINEYKDPLKAIKSAKSIFVGGGNTFVLLKSLYDNGLLDIIRKKVREGTPFIGTSAGANIAGKTIMTTNDMPIVYPQSFNALGLVPFVINPHYTEKDPKDKSDTETRKTRIKEYLAFNHGFVVGLEPRAMIEIIDGGIHVRGEAEAIVFSRHNKPRHYKNDASLKSLLRS
jgi:dipeptidase E